MGRDWAGMGRIGSDTVLIFGCLVLRAHFQGRQHSTPGCFPKGFPGDVVASIRRKGCLYPEKACWYGQGDFFLGGVDAFSPITRILFETATHLNFTEHFWVISAERKTRDDEN